MLSYETLFLVRTEASADDISAIEKHLDTLLSAKLGKLTSFDKWGKYRLAYSIDKQSHGVYILARYQMPSKDAGTLLKELDTFVKIKCHETVMRHVNIRLKLNAPSSYIKPDPIDAPRSGS